MGTYDVSEIIYGNNNYILADSKARAALITAINDGKKNLLNISGLYPKTQTINGVVFTINDDGSISFDATQSTATANTYFYLIPGSNDGSYGMNITTDYPTIISGIDLGGGSGGSLYEIQVNAAVKGSSSYTTYYQRNNEPTEIPAGTIRYIRLVIKTAFNKAAQVFPMLVYKDFYNLTSTDKPFKYSTAEEVLTRQLDEGAKNLIPHDAPTFSTNNITWTNNGDGSWTVSTSAASSQYYGYYIVGDSDVSAYADALPLPRGKYILTGLPDGASATTFRYLLRIYSDSSGGSSSRSLYNTYVFEVTNDTTRIALSLYVATNVSLPSPGVKYYPMLCRVEDYKMSTVFQPYRPSYATFTGQVSPVLVDLIDSGPKNLINYTKPSYTHLNSTFTNNGDGTLTLTTSGASQQYYSYRIIGDSSNTGWQYGIPIPRGKYILTGLPDGASSTTFRYLLGIATSSSATRTSTSIYDKYEFEVTNDTTRIDLSAYIATNVSLPSPGVTYYPMICLIDYWRLSEAFQPYRPSYQDLYDMVKALQT